jgi:hypothetical protein
MDHHPHEAIRVAIVLEIDDPNPDLLFIWAGIRAVELIEELWRHGICADIVSVDVDGDCHYSW